MKTIGIVLWAAALTTLGAMIAIAEWAGMTNPLWLFVEESIIAKFVVMLLILALIGVLIAGFAGAGVDRGSGRSGLLTICQQVAESSYPVLSCEVLS